MIKLHDICYLRLGCKDVNEMVKFAQEIVGLQLYEMEAGRAYLRGDNSVFNVCYLPGEHHEDAAAFQVKEASELEKAVDELAQVGIKARWATDEECKERRIEKGLFFKDPNGTNIELVYRPYITGVRFYPSRDVTITEFGHFGLHAKDVEAAEHFWTKVMSARVSDWIGKAPLLRINEVHHTIALFPSSKVGIQHVNFQVGSIDDIMRSWYFFQEKNVPIVFGPGRHPTSTAIFLYYLGPDNRVYEYSHGVKRITDEENYVPRQFEVKPSSFCMWGSKPQVVEFAS